MTAQANPRDIPHHSDWEKIRSYRSKGEFAKAVTLLDRHLRHTPCCRDERAALLCMRSECQLRMALYAEALMTAFEALHCGRNADLPEWVGRALFRVSAVYAGLQLYDQAIAHCEEAIEIHRKSADRRCYVSTLVGLSAIRILCGDITEAERDAKRAIKLADELGATEDLVKAKLYLCECRFRVSDHANATKQGLEAHALASDLGDHFLMAKAAYTLGMCYCHSKDYLHAAHFLNLAEERFSVLEDKGSRQSSLEWLARVREAQGEKDEALRLYKLVLSIERELLLEQRRSIRIEVLEDTPSVATRLSQKYPSLTPTEVRVCELLLKFFSNKEIARVLRISVPTVERHRFNIRKKLGLRTGESLSVVLLGS